MIVLVLFIAKTTSCPYDISHVASLRVYCCNLLVQLAVSDPVRMYMYTYYGTIMFYVESHSLLFSLRDCRFYTVQYACMSSKCSQESTVIGTRK